METITDPAGNTWKRTADRTKLVCLEDGREVIGIPEMTTDYLLSVAMMPAPKTEAERIAELETQVQFLLTKINNQ